MAANPMPTSRSRHLSCISKRDAFPQQGSIVTNHHRSQGYAEAFAHHVAEWAGSSLAFGLAVVIVLIWAATGPIFNFSDTWQLVINTGTTIVTFLMVFLIQRSQNKDSHAIHLKLNELVAAVQGASNRLIAAENLSEDDVRILASHYQSLAERTQNEESLMESHSIDEAAARHEVKSRRGRS
jgi:low affinity Fe/Cu permease